MEVKGNFLVGILMECSVLKLRAASRFFWFIVMVLITLPSFAVIQTVDLEDRRICSDFINYKGIIYMCYDHHRFGRELFKIDGSEFGTNMVKDIDAGPGNSEPSAFFEHGDHLYFFAKTAETGWALWRTDGRKSGTQKVKDLFNIDESLYVHNKIKSDQLGSKTFFYLWEEIYYTDGTEEGTQKVNTLGSSDQTSRVFGNYLYFIAYGDQPILKRVNESGVVEDIKSFNGAKVRIMDHSLGDKMLLDAYIYTEDPTDPPHYWDFEYWVSDGTESGTEFIKSHAEVGIIGSIGNNLLYLERDSFGVSNLFSTSDFISSTFIKNVGIGQGNGFYNFKYDSRFYILGRHFETFVTDGTFDGTNRLNIEYKSISRGPSETVSVRPNGEVIGKRNDTTKSVLTYSDGSTYSTIDIFNSPSYIEGRGITKTSNLTLFNSENSLYRTDGTIAGTKRVKYFNNDNWFMDEIFATVGQRVYFKVFSQNSSPHKRRVWHSDGTKLGTYHLKYRYDDGVVQPPEEEPDLSFIVPSILKPLIIDD